MRRPKSRAAGGRRSGRKAARPCKYDMELERMARLLMDAPFNREGADKSYSLRNQWAHREFIRLMREGRDR